MNTSWEKLSNLLAQENEFKLECVQRMLVAQARANCWETGTIRSRAQFQKVDCTLQSRNARELNNFTKCCKHIAALLYDVPNSSVSIYYKMAKSNPRSPFSDRRCTKAHIIELLDKRCNASDLEFWFDIKVKRKSYAQRRRAHLRSAAARLGIKLD